MNQTTTIREIFDPLRPLKTASLTALSGLDASERAMLVDAMRGAPTDRRAQVAQRLVELGEDDATFDFEIAFGVLLEDSDPAIRQFAVEGLWAYEDRTTIDPLLHVFQHDPEESIRALAALALGRFVVLNEYETIRPSDGEKVLAALRAVIDDPSQPMDVRRRAVEAAGASSEPWVTEIIWRAFDDPEPLMQVSALHAMGRNGDASWLPTLYEEMEGADPQRRFEAALATGSIGDDDAVPYLVDLFEDADPEVQEAAVAAVGEIGGDLALEALQEYLPESSPRLATAIRSALNQALTGEGLLVPETFEDEIDDEDYADSDSENQASDQA